jgi:hypothetical protein
VQLFFTEERGLEVEPLKMNPLDNPKPIDTDGN